MCQMYPPLSSYVDFPLQETLALLPPTTFTSSFLSPSKISKCSDDVTMHGEIEQIANPSQRSSTYLEICEVPTTSLNVTHGVLGWMLSKDPSRNHLAHQVCYGMN